MKLYLRGSETDVQERKAYIEDYEQKLEFRDKLNEKAIKLEVIMLLLIAVLFGCSFYKTITSWEGFEFFLNASSVTAIITGFLLWFYTRTKLLETLCRLIVCSVYRVDKNEFPRNDVRKKYVFYKEMLQLEQFLSKYMNISADNKKRILNIDIEYGYGKEVTDKESKLYLYYMYADDNNFVHEDDIFINVCAKQHIYAPTGTNKFCIKSGTIYISIDDSGIPALF